MTSGTVSCTPMTTVIGIPIQPMHHPNQLHHKSMASPIEIDCVDMIQFSLIAEPFELKVTPYMCKFS